MKNLVPYILIQILFFQAHPIYSQTHQYNCKGIACFDSVITNLTQKPSENYVLLGVMLSNCWDGSELNFNNVKHECLSLPNNFYCVNGISSIQAFQYALLHGADDSVITMLKAAKSKIEDNDEMMFPDFPEMQVYDSFNFRFSTGESVEVRQVSSRNYGSGGGSSENYYEFYSTGTMEFLLRIQTLYQWEWFCGKYGPDPDCVCYPCTWKQNVDFTDGELIIGPFQLFSEIDCTEDVYERRMVTLGNFRDCSHEYRKFLRFYHLPEFPSGRFVLKDNVFMRVGE